MIRPLGIILCAFTLLAGCTGGSGSGSSSDGGAMGGAGGSGGGAGGGAGGAGGGATCDDTDPGGDLCSEASECNVECKCENGSVTSGGCAGGTCASADDVCPDACEAFPANGEWTDAFCFVGTEGGGGAGGAGGVGGAGGQGGGDGAPILTECEEGAECASGWCVISDDDDDRWYCSVECDTDFDCPDGGDWACERRNHTEDNLPHDFCVAQ